MPAGADLCYDVLGFPSYDLKRENIEVFEHNEYSLVTYLSATRRASVPAGDDLMSQASLEMI